MLLRVRFINDLLIPKQGFIINGDLNGYGRNSDTGIAVRIHTVGALRAYYII